SQSELSCNSAIRPARAKDLVSYGNWMPAFYRSSMMHLSRRLCPYAPSRPRIPLVSSAPAALPTHETDVAPWRLTGFATAEPGSTEASRAQAPKACPEAVYVEHYRRIEKVADRLFEGEEAVLHVIERIVAPLGLRDDATSPWVDARLPDGSQVQTNLLDTPLLLVDLIQTHRTHADT